MHVQLLSTVVHKCELHNDVDNGNDDITLEQGSPIPRLRTTTGLKAVRNQASQQEVRSRRASKASSATPHRSPSLALPPQPSPAPIRGKIVFH